MTSTKSNPSKSTHTKLPKLPANSKVSKRPLLHPPIPSAYTSSQNPQVVYVSPRTPFMSAVSRTQKLLQQAQKRLTQSLHARLGGNAVKRKDWFWSEKMDAVVGKAEGAEGEVVWMKGTGRAVEKVLGLGEWFKKAEGGKYRVLLRTGSVWAVDDVVREGLEEDGGGEETRVRMTSCLEVGVSLR